MVSTFYLLLLQSCILILLIGTIVRNSNRFSIGTTYVDEEVIIYQSFVEDGTNLKR